MLEKLIKEIKEVNPKRVFLQLPEGLVVKGKKIQEMLFKEGIESFISLDHCYGSCDLRDCEALRLGCDLIVHVGHSDFGVISEMPVLYYEWRIDFNPVPVLRNNIEKLKSYKKIGLLTSVNYIDSLDKAKKYLEEEAGKSCFLVKGDKTKYPGQILGCDVSAALKIDKKVDCFLFIGSGEFHALGVFLKTSKPLFYLKREKQDLVQVQKAEMDKFLRQVYSTKALFNECKKVGILVSTKKGQANPEKAIEIKNKLEEKGKKATIFAMDFVLPERLLGMDLDCYVNCACPRIAIENRSSFEKPVLNYNELDL